MFGPELDKLSSAGLIRTPFVRQGRQGRVIRLEGRDFLNFSSNDYLGLAASKDAENAINAAVCEFGAGSGGSRLLAGGTSAHHELEALCAELKRAEMAMLFNSGYAANTGAIPAIAGKGDAIFSDELNHASLIDGVRLAHAQKHIYNHADADHLSSLLAESGATRKLVVTDTVFSMDGDIAPLPDIAEACKKHGAILYIDDAHGTGVLGRGRGALAHFRISPGGWPAPGEVPGPNIPIIQMGTLSKAVGSFGAFIAADADTIEYLRNTARSYMFSTALPAHVVAASIENIKRIMADKELTQRLWDNRWLLVEELEGAGIDTGDSQSPIVPVMPPETVEDDIEWAMGLSRALMDEGIYAPAIRPPTVKRTRLRLSITAAHTSEDIDKLATALVRLVKPDIL